MEIVTYCFRVLLIEGNEQQSSILEGRIRQKQAAAGYEEKDIEIKRVYSLSEAAFVLRHDKDFDCIYIDFEDIAPPAQHASTVRMLRNMIDCPIKCVARDVSPINNMADPRTTIIEKGSLQQIDASLKMIVQQMAVKKRQTTVPGSSAAAIARLEVETQNLWRELIETKTEIKEQFKELRSAMTALQDQTYLRVSDLPVQLADVETVVESMAERIEKIETKVEATQSVIQALKVTAAILKYLRNRWYVVGGTTLIPALLYLWELLKN